MSDREAREQGACNDCAPRPDYDPDPPRKYSRAWMREYLSVSGNEDD
jgi:hypothetical protein